MNSFSALYGETFDACIDQEEDGYTSTFHPQDGLNAVQVLSQSREVTKKASPLRLRFFMMSSQGKTLERSTVRGMGDLKSIPAACSQVERLLQGGDEYFQNFQSLGNAERAIDLNKSVYLIRLNEKPLKQVLPNDYKSALEWFQSSRDWWAAYVDSQVKTRNCPSFILKKYRAVHSLSQ